MPQSHLSLKFIFTFLTVSLFYLSNSYAAEHPWQSRINKNGITVDTRPVDGSALLEFKAEITVSAPLAKVLSIFDDPAQTPLWYYQCSLKKLVTDEGEGSQIDYFFLILPFPVAQRNVVFRQIKTIEGDGTISYAFEALPDQLPKVKGKVRVPYLKSTWRLTPLAEGGTKIYFQQHSDAGGSLPAFLANSLVVDIPYHSLRKLRGMVEE